MSDTIHVTIRWAGPADAIAGSTYKLEYAYSSAEAFNELVAAQAATSPYVSPTSTLSGNTDYGATSVVLASGTSFSASGYAWIDDALIQWAGKATNTLTGVTWHSGYGTYAAGTLVYEAHESFDDDVVCDLGASLLAMVFRVTHIDADGNASAPAYLWHFLPPAPASNEHCVVLVAMAADLGIEWQFDRYVQCILAADDQFEEAAQLNQNSGIVNPNLLMTNVFGLVAFQCWRSSARRAADGGVAAYTFVLDYGQPGALTVQAATIPDRDWVLLSQIATA